MAYEWDPVSGGYRWVGPGTEPGNPTDAVEFEEERDSDDEGPYGDDFEGFDPPELGGAWEQYLEQALGEIVLNAAIEAGEDPLPITNMFKENWDRFLTSAHSNLFNVGFGMDPGAAREYYTNTTEGWQKLISHGIQFYGGINSDLTPFMDPSRSAGGGRGGGGGGSRALTPEEIRNQFDLDQLSARADRIKQGLVLETFKDPRGIARAYVDAVVAGKGEKKIDFDTFVEERVKETGRFKSIYRNLPPGMDPRQYIAPLYQQAMAVAPREAEARTIGAAQFGASAQQFQQRLNRTDAVTGSAPFINKMQTRLGQLKGILRG
jgi:hypothetical protein